MKTFITAHTGGEPIVLDDLRWLTEGLTDSYQSMIKSIIPDDVVTILYGCERTDDGTHINITAGFISFSGEIYRVPAHSVLIVSGDEYWKFEEVYDPNGLKAYAAPGVSHDTYQEVLWTVGIADPPPGGAVLYAESKSIFDFIKIGIGLGVNTPWAEIVGAPYDVPYNETAKYMRDRNGFVHFKGAIVKTTAVSPGFLIGTLPPGFRPDSSLVFAIPTYGFAHSTFIGIDTDGKITTASDLEGAVFMSSIPPFKTM